MKKASSRRAVLSVLSFGDEYLPHFAADPRDPERLYAVTHNSRSRTQGVIASRDGGEQWTGPGAE